jgi:O-antigen ligase
MMNYIEQSPLISRSQMMQTRFCLFCLVIIVYAVFGYPTPDTPGAAEIMIGLGLIFSIGLPQAAFRLLVSKAEEPLWMKPARLLLLYGLSIPLLMALLSGNETGAIVRDLIPFLFMLLPFFIFDLLRQTPLPTDRLILALIVFSGLAFALRGYMVLKYEGFKPKNLDALYLVNAPTVLFAALFLSGTAIYLLRLYQPRLSLLAGLLALLPLAAMGLVLQRASFLALSINSLFLWVLSTRQSLFRGFLIVLGFAGLLYLMKDPAYHLLAHLMEKNRLVGSNMRLFEFQAVWERVAGSSLTALFGQGWGGSVKSPAVGGLSVNYTHSLLSAALLKTGLVGTLLTLFYLGGLFLRFPALYKISPVLAISLFWPFFIDIFFYASYKSLDFGFILMLIACYGLAKNKNDVKKTGAQNPDNQPSLSADKRTDGAAAFRTGHKPER